MDQPMDGGRDGRRANRRAGQDSGKDALSASKTKGRAKGSSMAGFAGLAMVAAVAVAGLGVLIFVETSVMRPAGQFGEIASKGQSTLGGPFQMIDQDGRPVTEAVLKGRWSAVFFGYTYCPDVCPATLQALSAAAQKLGPRAKDLQIVFVSIDPDRDGPAQMKAYVEAQAIPTRTLGLTGSPAQVAAMAKAYGVYYAKAGKGADYSMDHSAAVYLMDPQGRFAAPLSHEMAPDKIAGEIAKAEGRA